MNKHAIPRWASRGFAVVVLATFGSPVASAAVLLFDTELISMDLTGALPYPIPLASDPANHLGDSIDGYGFVNSVVRFTLSSQRAANEGPPSLGTATLPSNGAPGGAVDPDLLDGETFFVDSFFDVFFDITVTDVDQRAGRDYAGQADGSTLSFLDNGPANVRSSYDVVFDKDAPNFGLFYAGACQSFHGSRTHRDTARRGHQRKRRVRHDQVLARQLLSQRCQP